jgi:hypothetical protein
MQEMLSLKSTAGEKDLAQWFPAMDLHSKGWRQNE